MSDRRWRTWLVQGILLRIPYDALGLAAVMALPSPAQLGDADTGV